MISINVSGSSSTGNCTVLTDQKTKQSIVMDCGILPPPLTKYENILGIFVTHSHIDHTKYLTEFPDKSVYGSEEEMSCPKIKSMDLHYIKYAYPLIPIHLGVFTITPYRARHDTPAPLHYKVETEDDSVWFGCDAFRYDDIEYQACISCNKIMIECNYDENMMKRNNYNIYKYSNSLRKRIVDSGHASNQYIYDKFKFHKDNLILCHISKNYNSEECIREVFGKGIRIIVDKYCPGKLRDVSKRL